MFGFTRRQSNREVLESCTPNLITLEEFNKMYCYRPEENCFLMKVDANEGKVDNCFSDTEVEEKPEN